MTNSSRRFGRAMRAVLCWHYAENDQYFGPHHVRNWFRAFEDAGARGKLVMRPAFGADGHRIFASPAGLPIWTAALDEFLAEIGFAP